MSNSLIYKEYETLLNNLLDIVSETSKKTLNEPPDIFFLNNINFFSKSFLVNLCAYLESFIKDLIFDYISEIKSKLEKQCIPVNLINWNFNLKKQIKEGDLRFESLKIKIKKKDIDEHISGSPYRTKNLFKYIGIDLTKIEEFNDMKEQVNLIVVKRNKILHYNDDASDVSFDDIKTYIKIIKSYMNVIDKSLNDN